MSRGTPRIRMFAGPNGSGKSTLKHLLKPGLIGIYVNADDIEAQWRTTGQLDFSKYQVTTTASEIEALLNGSSLIGMAIKEIQYTLLMAYCMCPISRRSVTMHLSLLTSSAESCWSKVSASVLKQ